MSIFFRFNNTSVNIGKIRQLSVAGKNDVRVTFNDQTSRVYSGYSDANALLERFEKTIVQIMPCSVPMYNIFKNDDGSYYHARVCCLALCAEGEVRSIAGFEYFDLADAAVNFVGCYDEDAAKDFPQTVSESKAG